MTSFDEDILASFRPHVQGRSVLVLEDDPAVGDGVARALEAAGFGRVVWLTDGAEAAALAVAEPFDLLVLDRNTPSLDGREVLLRVRAAEEAVEGRPRAAALFLTALGVDRQRLEGLVAGADDYLVKPVSEMELLARAAALLRRAGWTAAQAPAAPDVIENGPLVLRPAALEAVLGGQPVKLTGREYAILALLAQNLGLPVTRSMIWDRCWPEYNFQPDEFENRIDVHASRLRKRLETAADACPRIPASARPLIVSIRNQGLMLRNLRNLG